MTDLVDSTGTTVRAGEAAASLLWSQHDRAARDLLGTWQGREVDKSDGFLLLFEDARQAAGYAFDYHRALAGLPQPVQARVGLHVAPIALRSNAAEDIALGAKPVEIDRWLAKAVVARVMTLTPGGRTLLSREAAAALADTPVTVASIGHWQLQGLAEPVELFELFEPSAPSAAGEASAATEAAPRERTLVPDSAKAHCVVRRGNDWTPRRDIRHTLPAEPDSFVGRGDALEHIADRYSRGTRLISILGAGGTGKTRLALRFGRQRIGDYAGGVWFCDLSAAQGLEGLVYAVAQGLELRLSRDDPVQQIGVALAGRPDSLVVFDNFEQVARLAEATIGRWLADGPAARFLVTSRSALHVRGESLLMLSTLPRADAAALFTRRARDAGAELLDTPQERAAIDALVRMLDGLPLALELAAARAKVMAPSALVERMGERFKLLISRGGRPGRQATLRTTLDWSWDLLGTADRSALAQLTVFEGGFRLADAEAVLVASPGDDDPVWAIDSLESLLEHSMLRKVSGERFDMLKSVQGYAAERLGAEEQFPGSGPGLRAEAEKRHWTHFSALEEREAIADGCAALENLVAACRRATAAGDASGAAGALRATWAVLGLTGPVSQAVSLGQQVERLPGLGAAERGRVQHVLASAYEMLGDIGKARSSHDAALADATAGADAHGLASALRGLGEHLYKRGDTAAARERLESARTIAERLGDTALLCSVHNAIGTLETRVGRSEAATASYSTALRFARAMHDVRLEGGILGNLAMLAHEERADDKAQCQYEEALALTRQVNDRRWEGNTRCNLGLLLQERGLKMEAAAQFQASLAIAREIGHPMLEGTVHCNLGLLAGASGEWDAACDHHTQAVEVARRMADKRAEGQFRGHLGHGEATRGRRAAAFAQFERAEACLNAVGDEVSLGLVLCLRARSQHRFELRQPAHDSLARAAELLARNPSGELRTALAEARRSIGPPPDG